MVASRPTLPAWSVNGTGITHMGHAKQPDGTYLATRWITVLFFPLVPLSSWIIRPLREVALPGFESRREFEIVRRAPLEPLEVLRTYGRAVAVAVVGLGPLAIVFEAGLYAHLQKTDKDMSVAVVMAAVFWLLAVMIWVTRRVEMIYEIAERKAERARRTR
jgi:hypothetical protein